MQESFLHFIWQFQYFDKDALCTSGQESLNILNPGNFNTDAGPDFKEARLVINGLEWRGHIEIHHKSSNWNKHGHQKDKAYNNVILHVVWDHDLEVKRADGTIIPTLELKHRIADQLIFNYKKLVNSPNKIPCENQIQKVNSITWLSQLDKVLMERLEKKALGTEQLLGQNKMDWDETAYQVLAKNFGFKVNSEPFLLLAQSLPYKIIKKHALNHLQVEALLLGQAGFLEETIDNEYYVALSSEYNFLKHKYSLNQALQAMQWKLLRLRPANFPMVRLAQFARVLSNNATFFQNFLEVENMEDLKKILKFNLPEYWSKHYHWDKVSARSIAPIGNKSIENIAINTLAPLFVVYGRSVDDVNYIDKAVNLLQGIQPEKNRIINYWKSLGVEFTSAFDSQALIQQYNEYCNKRKCLSCNVGMTLMQKE